MKIKSSNAVKIKCKNPSELLDLREHDDERTALLPAHVPEVGGRVRERPLCGDVARHDARRAGRHRDPRGVYVAARHTALQQHARVVICIIHRGTEG